MVHSTSTTSLDIMEIKHLKQNLLSRILPKEKYIYEPHQELSHYLFQQEKPCELEACLTIMGANLL